MQLSMYHVFDCHADCPRTPDIWSHYQGDKIIGTKHHKSKRASPIDVKTDKARNAQEMFAWEDSKCK